MGRDVKQQLRLGIILAEHGEGAVIRRAGPGGNALGHLLLNHDGDGLKAFGFQQRREDGGGDIVRQIGAGHGPEAGQLFRHQLGDAALQDVSPDDFHIVKFPHGQTQNGLQPVIHLHGADLPRPQGKLLGQRADAGADLQHAHIGFHPGFPGDGLRHPGGNEKILPLGFGKMEAMLRQQRLHHLNIAYIYHIKRLSFGFMENFYRREWRLKSVE